MAVVVVKSSHRPLAPIGRFAVCVVWIAAKLPRHSGGEWSWGLLDPPKARVSPQLGRRSDTPPEGQREGCRSVAACFRPPLYFGRRRRLALQGRHHLTIATGLMPTSQVCHAAHYRDFVSISRGKCDLDFAQRRT
jgi:hypothetical protein